MKDIQLAKISTRAPKNIDKEEIKKRTSKIIQQLDDLQNLLYAESKKSILIILQGMDASGKDGTIRRVLSTLNPQGVQVQSFKVPTPEELAHDFLWRVHKHTPVKGMIQVFNRSQYEDVLVTRVHNMITDETALMRMKAINDFESLLINHNNTHILKFYLHISQEEQLNRLRERLDDKTKQWKYNENDIEESKLWEKYMEAYEDCINHCNTVPWTIVPSDQNWYKEYIVANTLHSCLKGLKMRYPGLKK